MYELDVFEKNMKSMHYGNGFLNSAELELSVLSLFSGHARTFLSQSPALFAKLRTRVAQ